MVPMFQLMGSMSRLAPIIADEPNSITLAEIMVIIKSDVRTFFTLSSKLNSKGETQPRNRGDICINPYPHGIKNILFPTGGEADSTRTMEAMVDGQA